MSGNHDKTLYKLHNKELFKCIINNQDPSQENSWKMIVNPINIKSVLEECHDIPLAGHLGIKKTILRVKEKYFWPKLIKDVTDYVKGCDRCKCMKYPTQISRPLMGKGKEVDQPWEMISMDYIGPLPRSRKGNTMLYVVIDFLSKYCILKPLRTGKTPPLIKFLEEDIFLVYNVPRIIISDNIWNTCYLYRWQIYPLSFTFDASALE